MENSNNEQKSVEQLAEQKYPMNKIEAIGTKQYVDEMIIIHDKRLAFIAGHTAATEGMVKKDEDYKSLKAQFDNQMKHKESIKKYWLSCSESKAKWMNAIKEYFDSEHTEIKTFEEFTYQFDLD